MNLHEQIQLAGIVILLGVLVIVNIRMNAVLADLRKALSTQAVHETLLTRLYDLVARIWHELTARMGKIENKVDDINVRVKTIEEKVDEKILH